MSQSPPPQPTQPRGVSMPTIVFALVVGTVSAVVLVRELTGRTLDLQAAAPVLLLAAGGLLVLWALVGLARQQRRRPAAVGAQDPAAEHHPADPGT